MLIESIARRSKVSAATLLRIAGAASRSYKVYPIKKHDGTVRIIHHPSRALKSVQRLLTRSVISKAPIHESATAYKKGASIKTNAALHKNTEYTVRVDFQNFFPTFERKNVRDFLETLNKKENLKLDDRDVQFILDIFLRYDVLTIGAPSSPAITNAMMFQFDNRMTDYALANGLIFSRYADDIFVSSNQKNQLFEISDIVQKLAEETVFPELRVNDAKTVHLSRKGHRSVTGLVITPNYELSIGRNRKRYIRSLVYRYYNRKLVPEEVGKLEGLLAFALDVEPEFLDRMNEKFGGDVRDIIIGI